MLLGQELMLQHPPTVLLQQARYASRGQHTHVRRELCCCCGDAHFSQSWFLSGKGPACVQPAAALVKLILKAAVLHTSIVLVCVVEVLHQKPLGVVWLLRLLAPDMHIYVRTAGAQCRHCILAVWCQGQQCCCNMVVLVCCLVCYAASVAQFLSVLRVPYCIPGMAQPAIVLHCEHISTTVPGLGVKACHIVHAGKCNASLLVQRV